MNTCLYCTERVDFASLLESPCEWSPAGYHRLQGTANVWTELLNWQIGDDRPLNAYDFARCVFSENIGHAAIQTPEDTTFTEFPTWQRRAIVRLWGTFRSTMPRGLCDPGYFARVLSNEIERERPTS